MIVFANEIRFLKKNKIIVTSDGTKLLNNLKKDEILACLVEVSKLQSVIRQRDFLLNYNLCFDITWISFIS